MNIREMPWFERPGARLKRSGPEVLSDAELLAIVLGRGSKEENVIDCSRRVLREANLNFLAEQSVPELAKTFGDDDSQGTEGFCDVRAVPTHQQAQGSWVQP